MPEGGLKRIRGSLWRERNVQKRLRSSAWGAIRSRRTQRCMPALKADMQGASGPWSVAQLDRVGI